MKDILIEECNKLNYKPRQVQIDAIEWLKSVWNTENKCKVLSLPVGSGKSLIAKTIGEYCGQQNKLAAVITPQNILIDQYVQEFDGLNYLKGKIHYPCELTQTNCEEGEDLQKILKKTCNNCPYKTAKERAYNECLTIFNPMSFYTFPKLKSFKDYNEIIYDLDTMIIDEVQSLPAMLRELSTIKIWKTDISWQSGISASIPQIIELLEKYNDQLLVYIINENTDKRDRIKYTKQQKKIDFLVYQLTEDSQFFICEENREKHRGLMTDCLLIRPKYVPPTVRRGFFKIAKRIILMSGTAFPNIWQELGFDKVDYIDLPSPIPKERRQIFITNSITINAKLNHLDRWDMLQNLAIQIKHIVDNYHTNESGVVLLPYSLAAEMKSLLSDEHYIHMDKSTKKEKIDSFKKGNIYGVGIFSGSNEGISLNDHISRFTIIPKAIFPNLIDRVVKTREKENPLNYAMETMTTIIQASGRSTRSEKDFSYIYILDTSFANLFSKTRKYVPNYFKESLNFSLPTEQHFIQLSKFQKEYYHEVNSITAGRY